MILEDKKIKGFNYQQVFTTFASIKDMMVDLGTVSQSFSLYAYSSINSFT